MNTAMMPGLPRYGAVELLEVQKRFILRALLTAIIFEFILLAGYHAWRHFVTAPKVLADDLRILVDLPPAPPVNTDVQPLWDLIPQRTRIRPSNGTPVPVPDVVADPESTVPTQAEMGMEDGLAAGIGDGDGIVYRIPQNLQIETPPKDFTPVERDPVCIHRVNPAYPEVARLAGLEGTVYVKLWIDKAGKVRQVVLLKSDNPIFDQAVIDAAKQWVFTPAMMNAGPVAVWVAMPFRFALR